jgi:hypothetical protein
MKRLFWLALLVIFVAACIQGTITFITMIVDAEGNALRGTIPLFTPRGTHRYPAHSACHRYPFV